MRLPGQFTAASIDGSMKEADSLIASLNSATDTDQNQKDQSQTK